MAHVPHQKSNTRFLIASFLFFLSILASFLFNFLAHNAESYWVLNKPIASGTTIVSSDLQLRKATLDSSITGYLTSKSSPVGFRATRNLVAGELLARSALSASHSASDVVTLSISIRAVDLPESVQSGDVVDLYFVDGNINQSATVEPYRVVERAFVLGVTRNSANFSSDIALTISIDNRYTSQVLSATAHGRVVAVLSVD